MTNSLQSSTAVALPYRDVFIGGSVVYFIVSRLRLIIVSFDNPGIHLASSPPVEIIFPLQHPSSVFISTHTEQSLKILHQLLQLQLLVASPDDNPCFLLHTETHGFEGRLSLSIDKTANVMQRGMAEDFNPMEFRAFFFLVSIFASFLSSGES